MALVKVSPSVWTSLAMVWTASCVSACRASLPASDLSWRAKSFLMLAARPPLGAMAGGSVEKSSSTATASENRLLGSCLRSASGLALALALNCNISQPRLAGLSVTARPTRYASPLSAKSGFTSIEQNTFCRALLKAISSAVGSSCAYRRILPPSFSVLSASTSPYALNGPSGTMPRMCSRLMRAP
ncbi:hypothetical protein D3C81_1694760 [compost metagenome]